MRMMRRRRARAGTTVFDLGIVVSFWITGGARGTARLPV
jgi:hypothetical protein